MGDIARLSDHSDWIEVDFVKQERTPSELMKLGVRLHLAKLSLTYTVKELETFRVRRSQKAVHGWVQKSIYSPPETSARITLHSSKQ